MTDSITQPLSQSFTQQASATVLLIDNYDSFVYNLYQYMAELLLPTGVRCDVVRNDKLTVADVLARQPLAVVLSPGPGRPEQAGICVPLLKELGSQLPMLGVCLGHQALTVAFGGEVVLAPSMMHGKTSEVYHQGQGLFAGLPSPFEVARYHSLIARAESLPDCLEVTAQTADGIVMGLRHRQYPLQGLQFHPESIATQHGKALIRQFLAEVVDK